MPFLQEFLLIFVVALSIVLVFNRIRIPSIIGLLTAGVVIGPSALGVINDPETVEAIAELGLIPLLFMVGIEFSLAELKRLKFIALWGGGFQILTTFGLVAMVMYLLGLPLRGSIFLGFVVTLSSTALLVKILMDRLELDTPQGKILVGILLAQDVFVIILMFLLPIFAAERILFIRAIGKFALGIFVIFITFFVSKRVLPSVFYALSRIKEREIYTIALFIFVIGVVWLASQAGLSIALGAFLAGIIISEQEYKHYATAQIMPFKDILSSLFFISIGMLFDLGFFRQNLFIILLMTLGVIVIKTSLSILATLIMKYPFRIALIVGMGLSQLGEFSFILAETGKGYQLIGEHQFQVIVAVIILTLFLTPFLLTISSSFGYAFSRLPPSEVIEVPDVPELSNHTVIIGYGLNGRNLAKVLRSVNLPYTVLELNPKAVKDGKEGGYSIVFGDATQRHTLEKIGIDRARLCVIAISDRLATERIVSNIRMINPDVRIIVRTRYVADVRKLFELGASEVIPEEFETSVEIFVRALKEYRVPGNVIASQVAFIRQDGYRVLRDGYTPELGTEKLMDFLKESIIETFLVRKGSRLDGKTLFDIDLRKETGVTVIAIIRGGRTFVTPGSDFCARHGDILVLVGSHEGLDKACRFLEASDVS